MPRIVKYEFKQTSKGRELILWQPLERGGKAVLASVMFPKEGKASQAFEIEKIDKLVPHR